MADSDMNIVSMKRTAAEKKAMEALYKEGPVSSSEDYGYGLQLSLGKSELNKLGIKDLPEVGDEFHIYAVARVTSVSAQMSEKMADTRSVNLQITEMGAMHEDDAANGDKGDSFAAAAAKLYGKAEKAEGEKG